MFAIPFLTLYVENDYFFPFITGKNFWFRIIVDFTLVAWIALAMYEPRYRPQWSWIVGGAGTLLVIMFFANLFGEHPRSSFWSNFERMDGYVSLVHTYLYMIILGSVLKTSREWSWLLNTSLVAATLVAIGGLAQYFSVTSIIEIYNIGSGSARVDSTLGNSAYMAVYMLFHIFIALWLLAKSKVMETKIVYASLIPFFVFVLTATGTRGTFLALVGGALVTVLYILFFGRGEKAQDYRRYAVGSLVGILILIAGFVTFKDTELMQSQPSLARVANIDLGEDLRIRGIIWGMAWEGIQERPLLGWGQSNFNYVFNEKYDPRLHAQEHWFDRAHNIFIDWLIAGGFLGLAAYLSIFFACAYYLVVRPLRDRKDESFTLVERGILLGLLAGYFVHNLVVFDNIVSYIFFAIILGLIHSRVSTPIKVIAEKKVEEPLITQAVLPIGAAAFIAVMVFVHAPAMSAAGDIINAFRSVQPSVVQGVQQPPEGPEVMLENFKTALDRESFGHQEITEQIAQQTMGIARQPQATPELRAAFASTSEEQLTKLAAEKPGDARIHVFIASYYRAVGQIEKAAAEMAKARELSPNKQTIINQQGFIELSRNQNIAARDFFQESFELEEENIEAREYYAAALLYAGNATTAVALMDSEDTKKRFAGSDFVLGAARTAGASVFLLELHKERVKHDPNTAQNWASLAFLYFEQGDNEQAIATLEEGGRVNPGFASTASCIAQNIVTGSSEPQTGC